MVETRRDKQRQVTLAEIKSVARQQMAETGTGTLSLRGVAAAMGLTAPALYRYYPSRDDLITALILEAYHDLADTVAAARDAAARDAAARDAQAPVDFVAQMRAALIAYRDWAIAHRVDFELIFGNPIAGYHAPAEQTVPAATRNLENFVGILARAKAAGRLHPPAVYMRYPRALANSLAQFHPDTDVVYLATRGWTRIHGLLMLELFDHTPPVVGDPAAFYAFEMDALIEESGLT